MPDIEKIRELIDMMVANDLVELSVREGEMEVSLRRSASYPEIPAAPASENSKAILTTAIAPASAGITVGQVTAGPEEAVAWADIRSPMVGTFYAASDPDSPPFVQVGSMVEPDTIVCILEAMKVFSEIKAETSGVVERILVKDGEAVEYGQSLFLVRPS